MLQLSISDWQKRINKQFNFNLYQEIIIDNIKNTQEITNFEYVVLPIIEDKLVSVDNKEEYIERDFIICRSMYVCSKYFLGDLIGDLNTRRASFVNNYDSSDNHCISYFHHYIRDNKYCINVYARSMNYSTNFVFDNQTFILAYNEVFNLIKRKYEFVDLGFIKVFVFSLHKYI